MFTESNRQHPGFRSSHPRWASCFSSSRGLVGTPGFQTWLDAASWPASQFDPGVPISVRRRSLSRHAARGLIGVSAAGIDLSSLALVAGALLAYGIRASASKHRVEFSSPGSSLLAERPFQGRDWFATRHDGRLRASASRCARPKSKPSSASRTSLPNSETHQRFRRNWTHRNSLGRSSISRSCQLRQRSATVMRPRGNRADPRRRAAQSNPSSFSSFGRRHLDFRLCFFIGDVLNSRRSRNGHPRNNPGTVPRKGSDTIPQQTFTCHMRSSATPRRPVTAVGQWWPDACSGRRNGRGWHPTACRRRASGQFAAIGVFRRRFRAGHDIKRVSGEGLTWKPTVKSRGGVRGTLQKDDELASECSPFDVCMASVPWRQPRHQQRSSTVVSAGLWKTALRASSLAVDAGASESFSPFPVLLPSSEGDRIGLEGGETVRSDGIATVKVTAAIRAASQSNHCLVSATTGGQMPRPLAERKCPQVLVDGCGL